ncbi:MAG: DUF3488 and transglutaminase-like domain-containing protein [Acidimicrobiales bacterium]
MSTLAGWWAGGKARPAHGGRLPRDRTPMLLALLALADAAAVLLASTPWLRAYQVAGAPALFALAAVAPVLLCGVVSRWLRFGPLVAFSLSATGLIALVVLSNDFQLSSTWSGLAKVPAQLLSETLPLGGGPYLLVAPLLLTWACGAASAEALLRPHRPLTGGLAIPLACFALAFAATTSAPPGRTAAEGAALLGAVVVAALARQGLLDNEVAQAGAAHHRAGAAGGGERRPFGGTGEGRPGGSTEPEKPARLVATERPFYRRSSLSRALAAALAAAALAVALGFGVPAWPALASRPATLSRTTQLLSGTVVDPVSAIASLRSSSPGRRAVRLFSVQVERPWTGYITVAALDDYDGDTWSFSSTFEPTGGRVPGAPAAGQADPGEAGTRQVTQSYQLERPLGLPFLPALDRPVQVDGVATDADGATGMLAADTALPVSYTVVSRVPEGTAAELSPSNALASGDNVPGGDDRAYTSLPPASAKDVADAVRFAVNLTGRPPSPSFGFLQDLASALRADEHRVELEAQAGPRAGRSIPAALAGTSLAQVMTAVTVDHVATPEQFATFYATVARYLGVPVRVVTGFRAPAAARAGGQLPAGRYQLTNRDAWTWDELPVLGYGWVVVDPTPLATTADVSAPPERVKATPPAKARQATALPGNGATHAVARRVKLHQAPPLRVDWGLLLGAALPGALLVALLVVLVGVPALRRRLRRLARHQPGDPALFAAGAWLELLDGLSRLGLGVARSAAGNEVVSELAGRFGEDVSQPARLVATLADQALYSDRWPVDHAGARAAWDSQHELYRLLRHRVGHRARARALLLVGTAPARPSVSGSYGPTRDREPVAG